MNQEFWDKALEAEEKYGCTIGPATSRQLAEMGAPRPSAKSPLTLALLSDTHTQHDYAAVPEADVLVFAGDYSNWGNEREAQAFARWLHKLPHRHKVVISGNHDRFAETAYGYARLKEFLLAPGVHYLDNQGCEIEGRVFWGSPWTPAFHNWAFNAKRGAEIRAQWAKIPDEVQVLITHGPPRGILDQTPRYVAGVDTGELENVGCDDLRARLPELQRLELHVFGHIHHGYGQTRPFGPEGPLFVNPALTSITREGYRVTRDPIVVTLP